MSKAFQRILALTIILTLLIPSSALASAPATRAAAPDATATITVLHTNDFHGNLEPAGSNPGAARMATKIHEVETAVGAENVVLLDAGDEMQGSLLSNINQGVPVIDVFNFLGYDAATFGNHEFDWGQETLISRTMEADYPFLAANLISSASCSNITDNWDHPSFTQPWITMTVGAPGNQAVLGIIGVTSIETPYITVASATAGLCFKDPAESIIHYYDEVKAAGADALIVISHLGYTDGGYGYGFPVYGDQTLATRLNTANKPVNLIIGGHSHTDLATATIVGNTTVAQAHYAGRKVGKATLTIDTELDTVNVAWERITVATGSGTTPDPATQALIETYSLDPDYLALINAVNGYTNVPLIRNYNGDSGMGTFVQDAIYNELNSDTEPLNDVDMVFNNAGGLRSDLGTITGTYPLTLTYGMLFSVLPFGNQTIVGDMTGAQIVELLNQSATLFKGALSPGGIRYKFYNYTDALTPNQPWAWGAYDVEVWNRTSNDWEALDLNKTYKVATNEFLAPAGQDGFTPFKYMTNITYWGDMLNQVVAWSSANYTLANPYNGPNDDGNPLDGRITREGNATSGPIVPVTILHHNDSHGNLLKTSYDGYTQLATLIKAERQHNPDRTILLNGGDTIQGDAMMYFFKTAGLGYSADGTPLAPELQINPMIAAMNALDYDAMVLGNHEFNFGHEVFTSTLMDANFPLLGANISDTGEYGLDEVGVQPYVTVTLGAENISLAILGISNHRVPNYELPSNIPGLTFSNPIEKAQELAPGLAESNDVVVALTHIGFTGNPTSVEVDTNVDTELGMQTDGIDAIIGSHSHTDPTKQTSASGDYKYLPAIVEAPNGQPVIINQAYRYNSYLGQVALGLRSDGNGGYEVVAQAGRNIDVASSVPEDEEIKAIVDPYNALLTAYRATELGLTDAPIDALQAYTQETTGANVQADASVHELETNGIDVDFHLSGAMSNRAVLPGATITTPLTVTVDHMFSLMPYENSLVVMEMNGPQLKAVLERAYRNYYYYKYVPGYGGYSYYTTCMIDINQGGEIAYLDDPATEPPTGMNVATLSFTDEQGHVIEVDFDDAETYYRVSTVNYLAAGSCNFNDAGQTLWPLDQIVADTQFYVRDAMVNYIADMGIIHPRIEGRLQFLAPGSAIAAFSVDTTSPVNTPVVFTNESYGDEPLAYEWDFGDGATSTDEHPTHTFAEVGVYTVTLTASNELNTDTVVHYVTIGVPPAVEISADDDYVAEGEVVSFTGTVTGDEPLSYLWDFGDGITSTLESPTHTFATADTYTVTLTVTNDFGTASAEMVVTVGQTPVAGFEVSASDIIFGQTVVFTNTSTGDEPLNFAWSFGDGITSTLESPTHTFAAVGTYTVTLTVTNELGTDTFTMVINVGSHQLFFPLIHRQLEIAPPTEE